MSKQIDDKKSERGPVAILIHLGLLVFGLTAWLTGLMADDYKRMTHRGFTVHSWLGIGLAAFAGLRLITGIIAPGACGSCDGCLSRRRGSNSCLRIFQGC